MSKQKPFHRFLYEGYRLGPFGRSLVREIVDPEDKSFAQRKHIPNIIGWFRDWDWHYNSRCWNKSWKERRRTQYRPEGRNAYQITTDFYVWDYSSVYEFSVDWEEFFKFQGIVINEECDREKQVVRYKVYGDLKEGFRSFIQILCERYDHQMEFEYI